MKHLPSLSYALPSTTTTTTSKNKTDLCLQLAFRRPTATLVSELSWLRKLLLLLYSFEDDCLIVCFDMASLGLGNYVVVVLPIGGSKAFDIKHVF
jgi:hypothetical protein